MKDLHMIRYFYQDYTKLYCRKQIELLPFEAQGDLEGFAQRHDASLQVVSTHQKKRPENLIFSRTFDFKILDMFEFGVSNFQSISSFAGSNDTDTYMRPSLIFQGEHWNLSDKMMRLKNYFIDFFGPKRLDEVNIVEIKKFMVFTATTDKVIEVKTYECKQITEILVQKNEVDLVEVGPSFTLTHRRSKIGTHDEFKAACKKPAVVKAETKKIKKNMFTNSLGEQKAKVYLQQQDVNTIATRKFKKQKPADAATDVPEV